MEHYREQDLRDPELELMEDITATTTSLKRLIWKIEGVEREAYVYFPPASDSPAPLIIAFHGHGGKAIGWAPKIVLEKYWPKAIVCYAQGLLTPSPSDREGQQTGWQRRVGEVDLHTHIIDKDIKFFNAMFDRFVASYNANPDLVFPHGWSNGGTLIYNCIWDACGSRITAIAPAAAMVNSVTDKVHIPLFHIAGTADPVVNFTGQETSAMKVRDYNRCSKTGFVWATGDYDLVSTKYPSSNALPVIFTKYDGGHAYTPNVPALVMKFFRQVTWNKG